MFGRKVIGSSLTVIPVDFFASSKHDPLQTKPPFDEDVPNGESAKTEKLLNSTGPSSSIVETLKDHRQILDRVGWESVDKAKDRLTRTHSSDDTLSVDTSVDAISPDLSSYDPEEIQNSYVQARHSLMRFLSVIYCLLLIVLGFCFPIAELAAKQIEDSYYEGFFTYLFGTGIAYLVFSYFFLVSPIPKHKEILASIRKWKHYNKKHLGQGNVFDFGLKAITDPKEATYTSAAKAASFYLRMDAVLFGLGSMIFSGLQFGTFFEYTVGSRCRTFNSFSIPILRFLFTFAQLYFLFLNIRIRTDRFTSLTRFGLMHILGTNMVIWVTSLIEETRHAYSFHSHDAHDQPSHDQSDLNLHHINESVYHSNESEIHGLLADAIMDSCRRESVIGQILQHVAPLLYPFIVEYSLICAALMYVMWSNIGIFIGGRSVYNREGSQGSQGSSIDALEHHHLTKRLRYTVDCKGATNGMFLGILTIVAMIISMVLFFFWIKMDSERFKGMAVLEVYIAMIILYFLTSVAVIVAFIRLRKFRFDYREGSPLDEVLLIASQMGVIVFNTFIIICGHHIRKENHVGVIAQKSATEVLSLFASGFEIAQSILQTVFLLDASRRRPYKQSHVELRPGRQMITFLLVSNFGMWFLDTLEAWRRTIHPVQIEFYGFWPWMLITHVSIPLTIFYRFHSSVCLSEIWKKSYKIMKH